MVAASPPPDRKVLRRPDLRRSLRFAIQDGFRQGGREPAADLALLCQPWGFSLGSVHCPVVLWHGEQDRLTPIAMGRHVADRLPDCRPHLFSEAGHFFAFEHPEALLRSLLEVGA
jgi:pimeloyl-ACP methyl ester carboxylesterase